MKLFVDQTRGFSYVPRSIWIAVILSLLIQCLWHFSSTKNVITRQTLPEALQPSTVRLVSLDDPVAAAKLLMLWLQAFDNQPGDSIPLKDLNYDKLVDWLDLILKLDSNIQYPLLAAIRFYSLVPDDEKKEKMIHYTMEKFIEKPNERWSYLAHAVYVAKHQLKDEQLALKCAKILRQYAKGNNVPHWAKQMEIFILEDMGELESAMVLIGGLLESGELNDPHQQKFLGQRLEEIRQRTKE